MSVNDRNGKLVASFPVEDSDQIMLVTDKGQLIRCPVEGIRIAGRSTQGVIVFDTAEDEHVVSVEHIGEDAENGNGTEIGTDANSERRIGAIRCSPSRRSPALNLDLGSELDHLPGRHAEERGRTLGVALQESEHGFAPQPHARNVFAAE